MNLLSVVVPCHNEEGVIERLHAEVMSHAGTVADRVELVLVDDGSADSTLMFAQALASSDSRVRVISFSRNFGKEAAMLAGLRAAEGDAVVIMDADLQHPPELLKVLVETHEQGFDQVLAKRTRNGDPKLRTALSRAYYRGINHMVDVPLADGVGDFRLLSRRAVDALLALGEVNRFSKGLFSWIGFDQAIIEYSNVQRAAGASTWTLKMLLNYGIDGVMSFNNKPLRASIWMGLWVVGLSVLYVAWLIFNAVTGSIDVPGYITIVAAVTGLGGIQLIFLGVIGEYIGRIYYETKARPHYIIRSDSRSSRTSATFRPTATEQRPGAL